MAISPIDLQINLSQQNEVGKAQQANLQQPAEQQVHQAALMVQQTIQNENTVNQAMESENREVQDKEGKGSGGYRGHKRHKQEEGKEEDKRLAKDPAKGRFIDIVK
jgi:hypothetical protein